MVLVNYCILITSITLPLQSGEYLVEVTVSGEAGVSQKVTNLVNLLQELTDLNLELTVPDFIVVPPGE